MADVAEKISVAFPKRDAPHADGVGDFIRQLARRLNASNAVDAEVVPFPSREAPRRAAITHAHYPLEGWDASLIPLARLWFAQALRGRRAFVLTLHEWTHMHILRKLAILPVAWLADRVVMVSRKEEEAAAHDLLGRMFIGRRLTRIPIGPNLVVEQAPADVSALPETSFRIGYFGVIYAAKQPLRMIEALAAVRRRRPDARLLLCGSFLRDDKHLGPAAFAHADALGVRSAIDYLGHVADERQVVAALAACDAFLLLYDDGVSARRGSFLTCASLGKPVVTTAPENTAEFAEQPWMQRLADAGALRLRPATSGDPEGDADALLRGGDSVDVAAEIAALWDDVVRAHVALYRDLVR